MREATLASAFFLLNSERAKDQRATGFRCEWKLEPAHARCTAPEKPEASTCIGSELSDLDNQSSVARIGDRSPPASIRFENPSFGIRAAVNAGNVCQ